MGAEAARVLDYADSGYYSTAAPAQAPYVKPSPEPAEIPIPQERTRSRNRAKEAAAQGAQSLSVFAVFGSLFAGLLMILVVLAQISFSEIASETVRMNARLNELTEQERRLEIEFENSIDMKRIEQYARNVLGMSKPDIEQVAVIRSMPIDSAEILNSGADDTNSLSGFASFISSLLEYF